MTETTKCLGGGLHDRNHKVFWWRVTWQKSHGVLMEGYMTETTWCLGGRLHDRNHQDACVVCT